MVAIRTAYASGRSPHQRRPLAPPRSRTEAERLLAEIDAFIARTPGMTRRRFAREAECDVQFVDRLALGVNPRSGTCARVRRLIDQGTRGARLLAEIEGFLARHPRITRNRFGVLAVGCNKLARALEHGLRPRDDTCSKVRSFIAQYEQNEPLD